MQINALQNRYVTNNSIPLRNAVIGVQQNNKRFKLPAYAQIISFTSNIKNCGLPAKNYDLNDKRILITGGTGSLGTAIIDELLTNYKPKEIIVYSRDEYKQFHMKRKIPKNSPVKFIIGDVRDANAVKKAVKNSDVVIHTAAMKHVAICDENKEETVKTNFFGTLNVINAALDSNAQRIMLISTDKAANSSNFYGNTKKMAENLFSNANKKSDTKKLFSTIRMGNILGSRGSVLPIFEEQKQTGELTITDENMTRFFISPKQAAKQVLSSLEIMRGGEIFIPKLKSASIVSLAKQSAPNCKIKIIGARNDEKIHEDLISDNEKTKTYELSDRYVILPEKQIIEEATKLSDNFTCSSERKEVQFSEEELKDIIDECRQFS